MTQSLREYLNQEIAVEQRKLEDISYFPDEYKVILEARIQSYQKALGKMDELERRTTKSKPKEKWFPKLATRKKKKKNPRAFVYRGVK